jgi:hypothetical protein
MQTHPASERKSNRRRGRLKIVRRGFGITNRWVILDCRGRDLMEFRKVEDAEAWAAQASAR